MNDTLGLPFVYALLVVALCLHLWGWWPEIQKIPWLQKRGRKAGSAFAVLILAVAGGWAAFHFEPPPEPPRVRITDHSLYPIQRWNDFRIRAAYINDGPGAIRAALVGTGYAIASGPLPKEKEDESFEDVTRPLRLDPDNKTEHAQGSTGVVTSPSDVSKPSELTRELIDEARKKKSILYIFAAVSYFRGSSSEIWRTESCKYWDLRLPDDLIQHALPHYCKGHNGVYGPFK